MPDDVLQRVDFLLRLGQFRSRALTGCRDEKSGGVHMIILALEECSLMNLILVVLILLILFGGGGGYYYGGPAVGGGIGGLLLIVLVVWLLIGRR